MNNFKECLPKVLKWEGGYVNHPKDPGGHTMKGITLRTFRAYYGADATVEELKGITQTQLEFIYRTGYWDRCKCDDLPLGVDYVVFDAAVNSGVSRSSKWLQFAAGAEQDGKVGRLTLSRISLSDDEIIIIDVCAARMEFLRNLSTWKTFGKGWQRRVDGVRRDALDMIKTL